MNIFTKSLRIFRWVNRQAAISFHNIKEINKGVKAVPRLLAFELAYVAAMKSKIAGEYPALIKKIPAVLRYKLCPMSKPFW